MVKLDEKSQTMWVWLRKMVLAEYNCTAGGGWWKAKRSSAPVEKRVINMI
jgi:hypothetical protein